MAISYSHKFGQIIGDSLELAVEPFLRDFSQRNKLYLDVKGPRTARSGLKLTWEDINNNRHDLDFVLEKNGTDLKIGDPVAFIECAWRRYTKHSKNKAQEIQGAIMPLFEKYKKYYPFLGVILVGEFTSTSLTQLQSLGFSILFISYDKIIEAYKTIGIDAYFDEETKEDHFHNQVIKWEKANDHDKTKVYNAIAEFCLLEINKFISELQIKIDRNVSLCRIWTIYGKLFEFTDLTIAREFLTAFTTVPNNTEFLRFEVEIEYSNGDVIRASYKNKNDLITFIAQFI